MAGDLHVVLSEGQSRYLSICLKRSSGCLDVLPPCLKAHRIPALRSV